MKKIGFVDYFISEWHSNNYPAWIKEICEREGLEYEVSYGWAELDKNPADGVSTQEWCKKMGVKKCKTIAELCEKSDVIMVLAPANPETHLKYAEEVLKYKKPTYIDKTFAPDYETAKKIFDLAKANGTKFFSTSALRYADELTDIEKKCDTITITGNGRSFDEYGIHVIEMTVKCMGKGVKKVRVEKAGDQFNMRIAYNNGKFSNIIFDEHYGIPFMAMPCVEGKSTFKTIDSPYFKNLMFSILKFFETGDLPFDTEETLEVMKLRDALIKGTNKLGKWIKVK